MRCPRHLSAPSDAVLIILTGAIVIGLWWKFPMVMCGVSIAASVFLMVCLARGARIDGGCE
jgi:hypothetical protein